jgi:hypothetical protein
MESICPVCGSMGETGQRFCVYCGAPLYEEASDTSPLPKGKEGAKGKSRQKNGFFTWLRGTDGRREQQNLRRPPAKSPYAILSPLQYLGCLLLMLLPAVGLVITVFWSMGYCKKENKRNLARGMLMVYVLLLVLVFVLWLAFPARFSRMAEAVTGKSNPAAYTVSETEKDPEKSDETAEREIAGWDPNQTLSFSGFPSAQALNLMMSGTYYIKYTMYAYGVTSLREQAKSEGRFAEVKTISGQTIRTLTMDGVCYECDDSKKQYCIVGQGLEGQTLPFGGTLSSLERVSSGEGQVNGVDCTYDEFILQGSGTGETQRTVRLYMKDGVLQAIYMEEPLLGGQVMMQVETLTEEIPEGLLEFPALYTQVTYDEMVHPGFSA